MAKRPLGISASSRKSAKKTTSSNPSTSTTSTTSTQLAPATQTYPSDSDNLTLSDLFNLLDNVIELLKEKTEEAIEESGELLRGILFGVETLLNRLSRDTDSDTIIVDAEGEEGVKEVTLESLNISNKPLAFSQLKYLQGFSLLTLASFLQPIASGLPNRLLAGGGGNGKGKGKNEGGINGGRKDGEPIDPKEWIQRSIISFEEGLSTLISDLPPAAVDVPSSSSLGKEEREAQKIRELERKELIKLQLLIRSELIQSQSKLIELELRFGSTTSTSSSSSNSINISNLLSSISTHFTPTSQLLRSYLPLYFTSSTIPTSNTITLHTPDISQSLLSSISTYINLIDQNPNLGELEFRISLLKPSTGSASVGKVLDMLSFVLTFYSTAADRDDIFDDVYGEKEELRDEFKLLFQSLLTTQGELAMCRFILEEEELEIKYRPDDNMSQDGEDDEEEDEVIPLPDNEDVKQVKKLGLEAIKILKGTVKPHFSNSIECLLTQAQSLQEAYLLYSCLINPGEEEEEGINLKGLKKVEGRIEKFTEALERGNEHYTEEEIEEMDDEEEPDSDEEGEEVEEEEDE